MSQKNDYHSASTGALLWMKGCYIIQRSSVSEFISLSWPLFPINKVINPS